MTEVRNTCERCLRDNTDGQPHTVTARPGSRPCAGASIPVTPKG